MGPVDAGSDGETITGLERDVRRARLAQAAHFDALVGIRDAQTLRLTALNEALSRKLRDDRRTKFCLPLQQDDGFPPRLWLDDVSYVEMEPDPRTFRLVKQVRSGHETVAETRDLDEMVRKAQRFMVHRLIENQRETGPDSNGNARAISHMIMVWLAGFTFGALSLLLTGVMLGKISF